jgi:serine/threonine protein kinase/formylglycine-generating enzyme required for sulfatase activity
MGQAHDPQPDANLERLWELLEEGRLAPLEERVLAELRALSSHSAPAEPAADLSTLLSLLRQVDPPLAERLERCQTESPAGPSSPDAPGEAGDATRALLVRLEAALEAELARERGRPSALTLGEDRSELLRRLARRRGDVDRYRVGPVIGRGGMGAVHEVWDADLQRDLAMKVLHHARVDAQGSASTLDPRELARFLAEAQLTARLDHPGIVPVHELGVDRDGRLYFTMKRVTGRTLRECIADWHGGLPSITLAALVEALARACEAVAFAHDRGVVHRDLKPANLMVGPYGETYVMDFGLARILPAEAAAGTVGEDARGVLDPAADEASSDPLAPLAPETEPDASVDEPGEPVDPTVAAALREPAVGSSAVPAESSQGTLDGEVIGTPSFMSPEQAGGERERVGPRSDVYSLGAILYQILCGKPPYVLEGARRDALTLLRRVLSGPPAPLAEVAPRAHPELVSICERAMAREPEERYASALELAADLRAHLQARVVRAHGAGPLRRLAKWTRRNRALAGSLCAVLAVLGAGLWINGNLLRDVGAAEQRSQAAALRAGLEARRVQFLADRRAAEALWTEAEELWPVAPALVPAIDAWVERARELLARLPAAREARLALEGAGRPLPAAPSDDSRLQAARAERDLLELRRRVRFEGARVPEPPLPAAAPREPRARLARAWENVDPERASVAAVLDGLALARAALEEIEPALRPTAADTLAWALFAVGADDAARVSGAQALDAARSTGDRALLERQSELREQAIVEARSEPGRRKLDDSIAAAQGRVAELERELTPPPRYTFEAEADGWWHGELTELEAWGARLAAQLGEAPPADSSIDSSVDSSVGTWTVAARRAAAVSLGEAAAPEGEAAAAWAQLAQEAAADPRYAGSQLAPRADLLPIGRDPHSGLFEFWHRLSGARPARDALGELVLDDSHGLVLVWVPGGEDLLGAQSLSSEHQGYDPAAADDERPTRRRTLSSFLIGKHELPAAVWARLRGDPAPAAPLQPAAQLSWDEAVQVLGRFGLALPSEAQWEFAARGGTDTRFWTGQDQDSLRGAANLSALPSEWGWSDSTHFERSPDLDDGYDRAAPFPSLRPNPFGLHHVLGNVAEWTADGYDPDAGLRSPGHDPFVDPEAQTYRAVRGGSFDTGPSRLRVTSRTRTAPGTLHPSLGLRVLAR